MQNLNDIVESQERPVDIEVKVWNKVNRTTRVITSCLMQDIKYHVMNETLAKKIWEIIESKYLIMNIENFLHFE